MIGKPVRAAVCLCLVAGFVAATPSSRRPPLNPFMSAMLIRAEQGEGGETAPELDLKLEQGAFCSGAPDYAKGVTAGSSPVSRTSTANISIFEKDRKSAVLSLIHYPWQDLGYDIVFMGLRPGYRAMTLTARHRIEIYVRPGEDLLYQAYDLAHELGHAFDLKYNNDERRRKWRALRGIKPSTPWFGCDACPDYRTPAGDFAETFAFLLLGPGNYHSMIAPLPKIDQVEELAEFCKIDNLSDTLVARLPGKAIGTKPHSAKAAKGVLQESEPAMKPIVVEVTPNTAAKENSPEALAPKEEETLPPKKLTGY